MAGKKRGASPPGTPSSKRNKAQGQQQQQQQSLSNFFVSPSKKEAVKTESLVGGSQEEEDQDALFALKIAAREAGVSLSEMRRRLGMLTPNAQTGGARSVESETTSSEGRTAEPTAATAAAATLPVHPLFEQRSKGSGAGDAHTRAVTPDSSKADEPVAGPSTPRKAVFDFDAMDRDIMQVDFTQDVLEFDPFAVITRNWPQMGGRDESARPVTPYALLSHAFIAISSTRSRLLITTVLTNLMRTIKVHDPESIIPAVYLITNHIAPNYEDVQLGIGGAITNKAIKSVTGKSARTMKMLWDQTGDPGDVAFEAKKDVHPLVKPQPITVPKLFSTLHAIASLTHSGAGSTNAKLNHVTKLLVASRGEEARWLVRTFHSHLRIGAVKKTLSSAIARCFSLIESNETIEPNDVQVSVDERAGIHVNTTKPKERQDPRRLHVIAKFAKAEKLVREVLARHPNFTSLLQALSSQQDQRGLPHLSALVPLRIGVPLSPMLGSITRSLSDVYTKLGVGLPSARAFVSEFKYDGQRVQIHAKRILEAGVDEDGKLSDAARRKRKEVDERGRGKWMGDRGDIYVRLFSRHLEDMTSKVSGPGDDPSRTNARSRF